MTKKADGTEWNAAAPDIVERLSESMDDEPEQAADLSEEIAAKLTDVLYDDDRIRRNYFAVRSVAFLGVRHAHGKLLQLTMSKRRKLKGQSAKSLKALEWRGSGGGDRA